MMSETPARYGKRKSNDEREMRIEHLRRSILEALSASYQGDYVRVAEYLDDAVLVNDLLKAMR